MTEEDTRDYHGRFTHGHKALCTRDHKGRFIAKQKVVLIPTAPEEIPQPQPEPEVIPQVTVEEKVDRVIKNPRPVFRKDWDK